MANPPSHLSIVDAASSADRLVLLIRKLKEIEQLAEEMQRTDNILKENPVGENTDALVKQRETARNQLDRMRRELSAFLDRYDIATPRAAVSTAKRTSTPESFAPGNSLSDFLKASPALVEDLMKRGHFAQSEDGTMWALVIADPDTGTTKGEAIIQLRRADGSLLETVEVPRSVGALRFTKEGLATTEADGSLKLRIPRRDPRN
jgi:hypothetical protein